MKLKQIGLALLFAGLVALTLFAVYTEPLAAIGEAMTLNWWSAQILFDLAIAWGFGAAWVWRDAKSRGANPLPWVLAVPLTGSIALLAYVVFRPSEKRDATELRAIATGA